MVCDFFPRFSLDELHHSFPTSPGTLKIAVGIASLISIEIPADDLLESFLKRCSTLQNCVKNFRRKVAFLYFSFVKTNSSEIVGGWKEA